MGCRNRQRINYTLATVQIDGNPTVLEGGFLWRRAGAGATLRIQAVTGSGQSDTVVRLTQATAEPLNEPQCTRWKVTGAEGVWWVEWVDHAACSTCAARRHPNR